MRKCAIMALLVLFLTGCGAQETFETVSDEYVQPVAAIMQQVLVQLPQSAMVPALQSEEAGTLYLCDGYTITLQTVASGDLNKTLKNTTGFSKDDLKIVETQNGNTKRYDCVWTAAGEGEDQVGRLAILDDGSYHYVLTTMAGASQTESLETDWQQLFGSFCLVSADAEINTGS